MVKVLFEFCEPSVTGCTFPFIFFSVLLCDGLSLLHPLSLFLGWGVDWDWPCSWFFGEIAPQQVWAVAICHSLMAQSGFPAPSSLSVQLPHHCPPPPDPPPPPPPCVHHVQLATNNGRQTLTCEELIVNPLTPNLSHCFLIETTHWSHFQTQQRDTVGENCWNANIVDFCWLQTAVRWQRLPRQ